LYLTCSICLFLLCCIISVWFIFRFVGTACHPLRLLPSPLAVNYYHYHCCRYPQSALLPLLDSVSVLYWSGLVAFDLLTRFVCCYFIFICLPADFHLDVLYEMYCYFIVDEQWVHFACLVIVYWNS
jgi:hypothetical protein